MTILTNCQRIFSLFSYGYTNYLCAVLEHRSSRATVLFFTMILYVFSRMSWYFTRLRFLRLYFNVSLLTLEYSGTMLLVHWFLSWRTYVWWLTIFIIKSIGRFKVQPRLHIETCHDYLSTYTPCPNTIPYDGSYYIWLYRPGDLLSQLCSECADGIPFHR